MAVHLLSYLKEQFTPGVVDELSRELAESSSGTLRAVNGSLPTLLGALARTIQRTGGAASILTFLDKAEYGDIPLDVSQSVGEHPATARNKCCRSRFSESYF